MSECKRILLFTHARTASHLLERMLSKQPDVVYDSHLFLDARLQRVKLLDEGPLENTNIEERLKLMTMLDEGYKRLTKFLEEADAWRKTPFIHIQPHTMISPALVAQYVHGEAGSTHDPSFWLVDKQSNRLDLHTNPTVLPDHFLLRPGTRPLFTCRHPILTVEATHRGFKYTAEEPVSQARIRFGATLRWVRLLYDWYLEHGPAVGIEPIVIDADDYMGPEKEKLMDEVCAYLNLDAASVIYSWPQATPEHVASLTTFEAKVHKTLLGSQGVLPEYSTIGKDLAREVASWENKYGSEEAQFLRGLLEQATPEYEYLRARCVRPTS